MEEFDINQLLTYVWPLILVAQLVASIYAVKKIDGSGPYLMVAGTVIAFGTLLHYHFFKESYDNFSSSDGQYQYAIRQIVSFAGRAMFLIGLLLVILTGPKLKKGRNDVLDSF